MIHRVAEFPVRPIRRAAYLYGRHNRRRKLDFARSIVDRTDAQSILIVGVHAMTDGLNNLIERRLAEAESRVVGVGLEPTGPDWLDYQQGDGCALDFPDRSFDFVFSNAVIEHVEDQVGFVAEHHRVGRTWMLTTPNRLFPVEAHYHTLGTHWRHSWAPRGSITRLLSPGDLQHLLPADASVHGHWWSPTLVAVGGTDQT